MKRGIENAFPEEEVRKFTLKTMDGDEITKEHMDGKKKQQFLNHVIASDDKAIFTGLEPLIAVIDELRSETGS